jgi:low temperature requirement protein LtrA
VLAALLGIGLVIALWWLYFDYIILAAERRLARERGRAQAELARDSYSYVHLFIVGSIIFVALGVEQTLAHVDEPLLVTVATALYGGGALYLLAHNAFRYRDHRTISRSRLGVALVSIALIPLALRIPATGALAVLTVLFVGLAAYETRWSEHRAYFRPG